VNAAIDTVAPFQGLTSAIAVFSSPARYKKGIPGGLDQLHKKPA